MVDIWEHIPGTAKCAQTEEKPGKTDSCALPQADGGCSEGADRMPPYKFLKRQRW